MFQFLSFTIMFYAFIWLKNSTNVTLWQEPITRLEGAHCCNHYVAGSSHIDSYSHSKKKSYYQLWIIIKKKRENFGELFGTQSLFFYNWIFHILYIFLKFLETLCISSPSCISPYGIFYMLHGGNYHLIKKNFSMKLLSVCCSCFLYSNSHIFFLNRLPHFIFVLKTFQFYVCIK